MSLSKLHYDEIMRDYERKQNEYRRKSKELIDRISMEYPRFNEINQEISSLSVATAKAMLIEDSNDSFANYKDKLKSLREEKQVLLKNAGYKPIEYYCSDCKDTGYLEQGSKCHCFKQQELNILYSQSNIKNIVNSENFNTFSYDYYSKDYIDKATGRSSLDNIKNAVAICKNFINDFSTTKDNIFMYGATGVGKTFVTNCIAKELLDKYITE